MIKQKTNPVPILIALAIMAVGIIAFVITRAMQPETANRTDTLMDTLIEQRITGKGAKETCERIYTALKELDDHMDRYDAASEISAINAAAGQQAVAVSESTYALLKRAVELAADTDGIFDPAIGPLTSLWHDAKEAGVPPDEAAIAEKLPFIDYRCIEFDDAARTVKLTQAGMSLDLGGIAKGYASDLVKSICENSDIDTALISLGGNVYSYKAPKGKEGYRIGIRDPLGSENSPLLALTLTDRVMSTSASYERYFEYESTTYHHIIDPKTGSPAVTDLLSITVISQDGALADCLSTTLYIKGMDGVRDVLRRQEAGESLSYSIIAIDKEQTIYLSPELRDAITLFEDKQDRYHLAA